MNRKSTLESRTIVNEDRVNREEDDEAFDETNGKKYGFLIKPDGKITYVEITPEFINKNLDQGYPEFDVIRQRHRYFYDFHLYIYYCKFDDDIKHDWDSGIETPRIYRNRYSDLFDLSIYGTLIIYDAKQSLTSESLNSLWKRRDILDPSMYSHTSVDINPDTFHTFVFGEEKNEKK